MEHVGQPIVKLINCGVISDLAPIPLSKTSLRDISLQGIIRTVFRWKLQSVRGLSRSLGTLKGALSPDALSLSSFDRFSPATLNRMKRYRRPAYIRPAFNGETS